MHDDLQGYVFRLNRHKSCHEQGHDSSDGGDYKHCVKGVDKNDTTQVREIQ